MQPAAAAASPPPLCALPSLSGVDSDGGLMQLLNGSASLDSDFLLGAGLVRRTRTAARTRCLGTWRSWGRGGAVDASGGAPSVT